MSRLERRYGSSQTLADSVASFQRSLDDTPSIGTPRSTLQNTQAREGEILLCKTTSGNTMLVSLSDDFQHGSSAMVVNDGPGRVDILCPPSMTFVGTGLSYYSLPLQGQSSSFVRVDSDRFMHSPSSSRWVHRTTGSFDFTDGSGLTSDGTYRALDLSSIVPEYATGGWVKVAVSVTGTAAATEDFLVVDGGVTSGAAIGQLKARVTTESGTLAHGVARMSSRSIGYNITSTVTACGLAVVGWKSL